MVSAKICGPKLSLCCSLLSGWAVIMLVMMGIALSLRSAAFLDDFIDNKEEVTNVDKFVKEILERYKQATINCYICAGLYAVTLGFSLWQYLINR